MKNFLIISLIVLSLLINFSGHAWSMTENKYAFYIDQLKDWGLSSISYKEFATDSNKGDFKPVGSNWSQLFMGLGNNSEELDATYLIISSSDLSSTDNQGVLDKFKPTIVIVICDANLAFIDNITCDYLNVESSESSIVELDSDIRIAVAKYNDKDIILVPENYFLSSVYSETLRDYLRAFDKSYHPNDRLIVGNALEYLDTNLGLVFFYSAILILIFAVFKDFFINLIVNPRIFIKPQTYSQFFTNIESWIKSIRWIFISFLILSLLIYLFILSLISVKDTGSLSVNYISDYLQLEALFAGKFNSIVLEPIKTFVFIYTIFLLLMFAIILIPNVIAFIKNGQNKVSKLNLKSNLYKGLLITLPVILTFIFIVMDIKSYLTLILILVVIYGQLLLSNREVRFSSNEKRKISALFIATVIIASMLKINSHTGADFIPNQKLVSTTESMVLLPYVKAYGDDYIFDIYNYMVEEPLFVNKYLVVHPQYKSVEALSLMDFSDTGNFLIVNNGADNFGAEIIRNKEFRSWYVDKYKNDTESMLYLIENFTKNAHDSFEVELSYTCTRNTDPFRFTIWAFHDNFLSESPPYNGIEFYINPSCEEGQTYEVKTPIELTSLPDGLTLLYLRSNLADLNALGVSAKIKYLKNGEQIPAIPIRYASNKSVLYESYTESSDKVRAYYLGSGDAITFRRSADKVNISKYINDLIKYKYIESPIRLWSTKENYFLKNEYKNNLE